MKSFINPELTSSQLQHLHRPSILATSVMQRSVDIMMHHITSFITDQASDPELWPNRVVLGSTIPGGMEDDVVRLLASVRTDLDRFSRSEAEWLMFHAIAHTAWWLVNTFSFDQESGDTLMAVARAAPSHHQAERARVFLAHSHNRVRLVRVTKTIASGLVYTWRHPEVVRGWRRDRELSAKGLVEGWTDRSPGGLPPRE